MQDLNDLLESAKSAIANAADLIHLDAVRVQYLGKKGELTQLLKRVGQLPAKERPAAGQRVNEVKEEIRAMIVLRKLALEQIAQNDQISGTQLDVTQPGRQLNHGGLHPITRTRLRIERLLMNMGFRIVQGPEIETDFYNFEALNTPTHHPARAMVDTFYFPNHLLLRSHTSPVQIREMERSKPPLRIIAPGRVYRRDSDITHTPMFHQVEGLCVDETTSFVDLKCILGHFLRQFFEQETPMRFRPSYFPFTEPSAEVDIRCVKCAGSGCRICAQTGWLEILGCGMVHPNVLTSCCIDSDRYVGYAFGIGIERLAMLRYNVPDIRLFYENDLRFLGQFH